MKNAQYLPLMAGALVLPTGLLADILVTDLDVGAAVYNGGPTATTGGGVPQPNLALGHTFNVDITPAAADLSGTVLLIEIGGTSNGTGLYLIDGVLSYLTKHNANDGLLPDSLNDTLVRPDGSTPGAAAVQSTFGGLTAGLSYSVAASWDQLGSLSLAVQQGTVAGQLDSITLTGVFGNWSGDESFSVGINPRLGAGGPGGSVGGMVGETPGVEPGLPFDVELDDETPLLKSFAGAIGPALYWNDAGTLAVVPEPSTLALSAAGLLLLSLRRRS